MIDTFMKSVNFNAYVLCVCVYKNNGIKPFIELTKKSKIKIKETRFVMVFDSVT